MAARTSASVAVAGRSTRTELMPTSAQSRCLPATYDFDPGSSPTRRVPRPGVMPLDFSRSMREVSSRLTADAVATPSRVIAVIDLLRSKAPAHVTSLAGGARVAQSLARLPLAPPRWAGEPWVQRERVGQLLHSSAQGVDIRVRQQGGCDDIRHLGELLVAETAGRKRRGSDAHTGGHHRRARVVRH